MANRNPWKARLAKAAKQPPGDIDAFRRLTWALLRLAFDDCAVEDLDQRRKALLAFGQLAGVYRQLLETSELGELESQVQELEALARGNGHSR
jgi:hypothetical protein